MESDRIARKEHYRYFSRARRIVNNICTRTVNSQRTLAVYVPTVLLFLIPVVLWTNPFSHLVNVGGDIPNVLLLHPWEFLKIFGLNITRDGANAGSSLAGYDSLAVVALVVSTLHLDPSTVISGATLAGCYTGVRLLVDELVDTAVVWAGEESIAQRLKKQSYAGVFAGLVAVFAPMIAEMYWTNFVPGVYLVAVVPCVSALILRYLKTGYIRYIILVCLVSMLGSAGLSDIPDALPTVPVVVLFLMLGGSYIIRKSLVRTIRRLSIMAVCVLTINAIWLVPYLVTLVDGQQQVQAALSKNGKHIAAQLVRALAQSQNLQNAVSLNASTIMMHDYGWPQLSLAKDNMVLFPVLILPATVIALTVLVGVRIGKNRQVGKNLWWCLCVLTAASVVYCGLVSMKIPGSVIAWNGLLDYVPGWTATRNFYVTFSIPYIILIAVSVGLAVILLSQIGYSKLAATIALIGGVGFCVVGLPLIRGLYFRLPLADGSSMNRVLSSMPVGYQQVVSGLTSANSGGGVLTLPLSTTDWSYLSGYDTVGRDVTYVGVSPLFFATGISDYNGLNMFDSIGHPHRGGSVENDIVHHHPRSLARLIRSRKIGWIVDQSFAPIPTMLPSVATSAATSPYAYVALSRVRLLGSNVAIADVSSPDETWDGRNPGNVDKHGQGSWWQPVGSTIDPTLELRVSDRAQIAGVDLRWLTWSWWKPSYPSGFVVQTSRTGKVWTSRASIANNVQGENYVRFASTITGVRYIRIVVTGYTQSGIQKALAFDTKLIDALHASRVKVSGHYSLWRIKY